MLDRWDEDFTVERILKRKDLSSKPDQGNFNDGH